MSLMVKLDGIDLGIDKTFLIGSLLISLVVKGICYKPLLITKLRKVLTPAAYRSQETLFRMFCLAVYIEEFSH